MSNIVSLRFGSTGPSSIRRPRAAICWPRLGRLPSNAVLIVGSLQIVEFKLFTDDGDSVVVEIEVGELLRIQKSVTDFHVDPIGVSQISTDIAFKQLIAMLLEYSMELAHGDPAGQNALEIQIFGDNPATQGEDGVNVRPALQGSDDGIVVVMQDLHLFAVVPFGFPYPSFRLATSIWRRCCRERA